MRGFRKARRPRLSWLDRRRRPSAVIETPSIDGGENVLEDERADLAPDSASRILAAKQALLVDADLKHRRLQCKGERVGLLLKQMTVAVGFAVALGVFGVLVAAVRSHGVVVEQFETPPELQGSGINGQTIAGRIQDSLGVIQEGIRTTAAKQSISNAWTDEVSVEVPQTGLSLGELSRVLRRHLGGEIYVSGSLLINPDSSLTLAVRGSGIPPRSFTAPRDQLDQLIARASEYLFGAFEPRLFAMYLSQAGRFEEQEQFTREQARRVRPEWRGAMLYYWAQALDRRGRIDEAIYRMRQSVEIDPQGWRAWNLLVSMTRRRYGYDAANRIASEIRKVAGSDADDALIAWYNHSRIVQDWAKGIEFYEDDVRRSRGAGSMTVLPYAALAEAEAHRHDWAAVERYIGQADPADTGFQNTRAYLFGMHRLEKRRFEDAAVYMRQFYDGWLASDAQQRALEFGHCYAGLAFGLAGYPAEAEAIFQRGQSFPQCRAHKADILEASGNRAAADAAYMDAVRMAPSVPYAYYRYGVALLARDDLQGAEQRLLEAHERGPNWADPLKALGDLRAKQREWRDASRYYRQALELAPGWQELRDAQAFALAQL